MKTVIVSVCMLVLMTVSVMAQGFGLQIGETATPIAGQFGATGGLVTGDDTTYIGARGVLGLGDALTLFGELGTLTVDMDGADADANSIAAGATLAIPVGLPVDLAVRGVIQKPFFDDTDTIFGKIEISAFIVMIQGVASMDISAIQGLSAYVAGGFAYSSTEVKVSGAGISGSEDESETELALAVGGRFALTDNFSVFAEISHVDDAFIGGGASILF